MATVGWLGLALVGVAVIVWRSGTITRTAGAVLLGLSPVFVAAVVALA